LKLFVRLECRDYCRFDWGLVSEGNPKLLEVNPNPGWCWDGHLAKIAGISYAEMMKMFLETAESRLYRRSPNSNTMERKDVTKTAPNSG